MSASADRSDDARGRRGRAGRAASRRPRRSLPTLMGIPVPLVAVALVMSAVMGLALSMALQATTESRAEQGATTVRDGIVAGRSTTGQTLITEQTLGPEVQLLVESGTVAPTATFNASRCMTQQGITDQLLIMEEVAWGPSAVRGWLLVHGPVDRSTLRRAGGTVSATVVKETCGESDGQDPRETRLWDGSVMIGGV